MQKLGLISIDNVANFCFFLLDTLGRDHGKFILSPMGWAPCMYEYTTKSFIVRIRALDLHSTKRKAMIYARAYPQRWSFGYMRRSCSPRASLGICFGFVIYNVPYNRNCMNNFSATLNFAESSVIPWTVERLTTAVLARRPG